MKNSIIFQATFFLLTYSCAVAEIGTSEVLPFDVTAEMAKTVAIDGFQGHALCEGGEPGRYTEIADPYYYDPILINTVNGNPGAYMVILYTGPGSPPSMDEIYDRIDIGIHFSINGMSYIREGKYTEEEVGKKVRYAFGREKDKVYFYSTIVPATTHQPPIGTALNGLPTPMIFLRETKERMDLHSPDYVDYSFNRYVYIGFMNIPGEYINSRGDVIYIGAEGCSTLSKDEVVIITKECYDAIESNMLQEWLDKYEMRWNDRLGDDIDI